MLWQWPQFCAHSCAPLALDAVPAVASGCFAAAVPLGACGPAVEHPLERRNVAVKAMDNRVAMSQVIFDFINVFLLQLKAERKLGEEGVAILPGAVLTIEFVSYFDHRAR